MLDGYTPQDLRPFTAVSASGPTMQDRNSGNYTARKMGDSQQQSRVYFVADRNEKRGLARMQTYISTPPTVVGVFEYLTGFRGLLVIQAFLWNFLIVFAPAVVKGAADTDGPEYQIILRKVLSVLFWNDTLLYSSIIMLSARVVCLPFMAYSSSTTVASSVFRRAANLLLPLAVILAVTTLVFQTAGIQAIEDFKSNTGNTSISTPYVLPNALAYFNSIFNLFWTTNEYATQAAAIAFPNGTLWVVNVVYQQSYTVFMTMIVLPYTRKTWRVYAFCIFIVTAWWVQSWAWYSVTGLLLADSVWSMDFKRKSQRGIKLYGTIRLPSWILYVAIMAVGYLLSYVWTAWRPQYVNYELEGHSGLYYTASYNSSYDVKQPQARDDNYLILVGFFLLLETSDMLQFILSNRLFVFLGKRSYTFLPHTGGPSLGFLCILILYPGYFLVQSLLMYTIGIKLYMHLIVNIRASSTGANFACFFVCLFTTVACAELMHWIVDMPGRKGAHLLWKAVTC